MRLLQAIGAMDEQQALSPLGYHLAKLPVPPKVHWNNCVSLVFSSLFSFRPFITIIFSAILQQKLIQCRLAKCCCGPS